MNNVNQTWYADDDSGSGKISKLHEWWDHLITLGPHFGYFAKASKTWLVTKENCLSTAAMTFADTNMKITSEGRPYLGTAIGTEEYIQAYVTDKAQQWSRELE